MTGGVTRQGGLSGLPDWITLSAGVKFCHANVSRLGKPPSRGRVRVTSNSGQIPFDGRFPSLKVKIESHNTERLQQKQQVRVEEHSTLFT